MLLLIHPRAESLGEMYILDFFFFFFKAHGHPKFFAIAIELWLNASTECHCFLRLLHKDFMGCHELLVI